MEKVKAASVEAEGIKLYLNSLVDIGTRDIKRFMSFVRISLVDISVW